MAHLGRFNPIQPISFSIKIGPKSTKMMPKLFLIGFAISLFTLFVNVESRPSISESIVPPAVPEVEQTPSNSGNDSDDSEDEEESATPVGESTSKQCCSPGWVQFDSHCYRGITNPPLPFFEVNKQCHKYGAHFVSIHSKEEYAFVKQNFDLNKYWIGVVSYEDGRHENEDGTGNDFQEFDDPVWDANESHPYICEINHCVTYGSVAPASGAASDEEEED